MTRKQIMNLLSWVLLIGVMFYFAYAKGWILADFESVSPKQAQTLLANDQKVFLLDVRTPEEFAEEHIEGATLIPLDALNDSLGKLQGVKEKKIVVYCKSGMRSVAASRILANNGFVPLNLQGGINEWKNEGLSVTR
jgi:rhodanese-related sulfurtransferase